MEEPRTCRKCGEPIPEGRGPRAEDCGLPKCKSKAYRLQKKAEADAMAAALAAKQADEKESKSANGLPIPIQDREPEQSPKPSAPSCDSIGATPSFQEVRLQPGQQSIVLVCGCGARTTIQISHTQAESESVQGTSPNKPESASAVAQPVASPVPKPLAPEAEAQPSAVANPSTPVTESAVAQPVASPIVVVATAQSAPVANAASPARDQGSVTSSVVKQNTPDAPSALPTIEVTQPAPSAPVVPADSEPSKSEQSAQPTWNDDLPDPIPFTVYEMYAYRGTWYDEPVLIEEALTKLGKLHPDFHITFTSNPDQGFKLCAPTGFHRILWGIAYKLKRCQLPKRLIVYGRRGQSKEQILSHNVDISMIEKLVGKRWQWMVGA